MVSSVAASGIAAIKNVLNRQVNVVTLTESSNLDAVRQGRHGSVSPTATAVLGNVLVERVREIANAIHVAPVEGIRQGFGAKVCVGKRAGVIVEDSVFADLRRREKERVG
jgi:hypothetical protein